MCNYLLGIINDGNLIAAQVALRGKIGGKGGIGDYIAKPKWMHRRTFERAMERVYGAEEIVEAHTALFLDRLMRRLP